MIHQDSIHLKNLKPNPILKALGIIGNSIWILIIMVLFLRIVYQQVQVDGLSMYPNYDDKQYLLVNQFDKNYRRGQVVALFAHRNFANEVANKMNPIQSYIARFDCQNPRSQLEESCKAKFYLKRIVGLPNEEIEIIGGSVIIYNKDYPQGTLLVEDYIPSTTIKSEDDRNYYLPRTKIADKEYFAMGDNRSNSMDSRIVGTFADYSIFGQENFRIIPTSSFHIFNIPEYNYKPIPSNIKQKSVDSADIIIEQTIQKASKKPVIEYNDLQF